MNSRQKLSNNTTKKGHFTSDLSEPESHATTEADALYSYVTINYVHLFFTVLNEPKSPTTHILRALSSSVPIPFLSIHSVFNFPAKSQYIDLFAIEIRMIYG